MIFLSILFLISIILLILYLIYKNHVINNSIYIDKIHNLNAKYNFYDIKKYVLEHNYDTEAFYNEISCLDYLIYELVYKQREVKEEISKTIYNQNEYNFYIDDIKTIEKTYDLYYTSKIKIKFLIELIINRHIDKILLKPDINFIIRIKLNQVTINNNLVTYKTGCFDISQIESIIDRINDKYGDRYKDREIWNSICRVERGKVSNRMRFFIYKRDNYLCQKCGRKSDNLEIDHIFPISKGGKSVPDNLQSLCHKCNILKSDNIEYDSSFHMKYNKICPLCGAPLKYKHGKYDNFYGCMNYPKCEYTEKCQKKS